MTSASGQAGQLLRLALLAIITLLVVLSLLIIGRRAWRSAAERRRLRIVEPIRPLLITIAASDELDPELLGRLAALRGARWKAAEPTLVEVQGKVRGDARGALVALLDQRGTLRRARRRTRRLGAVGRAVAAEVLGSTGNSIGVPDLVRLLRDRDAEVRQVAARALGRIGAAPAAGDLLRAVARKRDVPSSVVAQALLRIGAPAQLALVTATRSSQELVRAVAIEILGLTRAVGAGPHIRLRLEWDDSPEVRIRAARALGRIGMPSALSPLLDATRRSCPVALRIVAVGALGELGHPGAVPRLARLLADPTHRVASTAARSLLQISPDGVRVLRRTASAELDCSCARHARDALSRTALRNTADDAEAA